MKRIIVAGCIFASSVAHAQDSAVKKPLEIAGYMEAYYSYDLNKPANHTKPGFIYNYNRHNEFNINLAFVKASYNTERVRANLALAAGTYMNANYAAENGVLKNIYEANAGYKLSKNYNLWFDIGVLPSHIGFESATGKDNWALTRSLIAENSPYFESGAKLSYTTKDGKLMLAALALNGWQRIERVEGNSTMSWGTQVFYKPTSNFSINYSSFFGSDKPDTARLWRQYHDVYANWQVSSLLAFIAAVDIGAEQKVMHSSKKNIWYTPTLIIRATPTEKWAIALRGEYYSDRNEVIVYTGTANGFKTAGISANLDYMPTSNIWLRIEGRFFQSKDDIFIKRDRLVGNNSAITFSTAVSF